MMRMGKSDLLLRLRAPLHCLWLGRLGALAAGDNNSQGADRRGGLLWWGRWGRGGGLAWWGRGRCLQWRIAPAAVATEWRWCLLCQWES